MSSSIAIVFIGISVFTMIYWKKPMGSSEKNNMVIDKNGLEKSVLPNIIANDTATIFKNSIIISENNYLTKNSDSMDKLKAMSLLLLTDSTSMKPVMEPHITDIAQVHKVENSVSTLNMPLVSDLILNANAPNDSIPKEKLKVNSKDMSGTFYAEKLYWSSENNELYFQGKSIIIFGKNNFVNNGSASFLGKVYYLVINGIPLKLNAQSKQDFKLSEKNITLFNYPLKLQLQNMEMTVSTEQLKFQ